VNNRLIVIVYGTQLSTILFYKLVVLKLLLKILDVAKVNKTVDATDNLYYGYLVTAYLSFGQVSLGYG
jgi:hypothetical protein